MRAVEIGDIMHNRKAKDNRDISEMIKSFLKNCWYGPIHHVDCSGRRSYYNSIACLNSFKRKDKIITLMYWGIVLIGGPDSLIKRIHKRDNLDYGSVNISIYLTKSDIFEDIRKSTSKNLLSRLFSANLSSRNIPEINTEYYEKIKSNSKSLYNDQFREILF